MEVTNQKTKEPKPKPANAQKPVKNRENDALVTGFLSSPLRIR